MVEKASTRLDVALCACNGSSIESGEHTYPYHNAHLTGSILNPQWEQTRNLEHTGHNHRSGVYKGADRCRAFHGIRQPDVQREHSTLTGTSDEHQHEGCGQNESTGSHGLHHVNGDKRCRAVSHHHITGKREAERTRIVTEDKDTDKEEHIGKTSNDESLLRCRNSGLERIVESDKQI